MKNRILCGLFVLLAHVCLAQAVDITGKVVGKENEPVEGAYIHVLNTNLWAFSDQEGNFLLHLER